MYTHVISSSQTQDTTNHEVPILTPEQDRTKVMNNGINVANDDSDDDDEFTGDKDGFVMMTPVATLS
jgi:hypothetical protein